MIIKRFFLPLVLLLLVSCGESELRVRAKKAMQVGDYARAKAAWSALLDNDPANIEARKGFAMTLFAEASDKDNLLDTSANLWDRCASEFQILLQMDSSSMVLRMASSALFHQAHNLVGKERYLQARKSLDQALLLDSANGFAWNLLGLAWEGAGDTAKARISYEAGIARQPGLIACYVNLGNLHWRANSPLAAWEFWSLGLEQDSTNTYLRYWRDRAQSKLEEQALED